MRQVANSWEDPPLLLYKDINERYAGAFDGFYAWVQPGANGWAGDGSNWGRDYLDAFYQRMSGKYGDKLAVGAAWPLGLTEFTSDHDALAPASQRPA